MIWLILLAFILGLAGALGILYLVKTWQTPTKPRWMSVLAGEVPWVRAIDRYMRTNCNSGLQNSHEVAYVPRQEIAESGLGCPKCKTEAASRGDFSRVQRCFINGQENEVIKCQGVIAVDTGEGFVPCPVWLAASPNTEHGDELIEGDPVEFYRFTRIALQQALKEKYGMDVSMLPGDGGLMVDPKERPAGAVPNDDVINNAIEEILSGNRNQLGEAMAERDKVVVPFAEAETKKLPALPPIPFPTKDTDHG